MGKLLAKASYVVTVDDAFGVIPRGAIVIEGDTITEVGPYEELSRRGPFDEEVGSLEDDLLMPGLISAHHHAPGRTFRVAPFIGVELPTGESRDSDGLGTLPATLQLGSGSWDPFGGVVLTYQTLDYQIDAQASYKINTAANNFEFGDETRLDASLQYRLWPRELGEGVPGFVYGVLEGNLIYQSKNETAGIKDLHSGGISFFLSPGIQYVTKRWILEGIVQIPLMQDLNGTALEDDFTVRAGFRVNF